MKLNMKTLCSVGALLLCSESALAMEANYLEKRNNRTQNFVKCLVEHDVDINQRDRNGNTPLILASEGVASRGTENIVKYLIEHGANVNAQNNKGATALIAAISGNLGESYLIQRDDDRNSLFRTVKYLIEHKADINAIDKSNKTPLMYAVQRACADGSIRLVKYLIDQKADVNAFDNKALSVALENVRGDGYSFGLEIVKLLLDSGARVDSKDRRSLQKLQSLQNKLSTAYLEEEKKKAFFSFIKRRDPFMVKSFIEEGFDVINERNDEGQTALEYVQALRWGSLPKQLQIIEMLRNASSVTPHFE